MTYVAPFLGEFGWEVSVWAPFLRFQSKASGGSEMTVLCKPGHEALYADFANKVIGVPDLPKVDRTDCVTAWVNGVRLRAQDYERLIAEHLRRKRAPARSWNPHAMPVEWLPDVPPVALHRDWYRYGDHTLKRELVVAHIRKSEQHPERNTSPNLFPGEVEVCVGSKDAAMSIPHLSVEDMRGIPLIDLIAIFNRAKVVIGPSSGPLALAMLCGAPVVWWSPNTKDGPRFKHMWNPFGVVTKRASDTWLPRAEGVKRAVDEVLA